MATTMIAPLGWDARRGGSGTCVSDGVGTGGTGSVARAPGCWNIRVNSPGCPGGAATAGAEEGAIAGLWNARVNWPGWEVFPGDDTGFDTGAATGSGA